MCHLCHRPLLYFLLIRTGPPPMSTLVPAWRRHCCCSSAGSLRGTCPASALTSNWHSETQISSLELSPSCHHVVQWRQKAWCLDTHGFILKKIQWHIHAGSWSLVNCWCEALMRHYIRCSWILMRAAVSLMEWPRPWWWSVYPRDTPTYSRITPPPRKWKFAQDTHREECVETNHRISHRYRLVYSVTLFLLYFYFVGENWFTVSHFAMVYTQKELDSFYSTLNVQQTDYVPSNE